MSEYHFLSVSEFQLLNDDRNNKSKNFINLPLQPYHQLTTTTTVRSPYTSHPDELSTELNVPYTIFEILVAIFAIIGNLMVIIVFQKDKKLRRRTNYYIVSLAIADFLVGLLGVPFAILASVGLPTNLHACLFTVSLLVVLCTISIFCLVAVSIDRYWAILYPMAYSRNVRTKTAIGIISMCWLAGSFVGFLPLLGWHADVQENQACLFVEVMDYNYLVFLYFATIITPALLLLAFYAHIYRVIVKQVRQRTTMNPIGESFSSSRSRSRRSSSISRARGNTSRHQHHSGGTMLRVLGAARKRDVKATQNLSIIVLFFMICWIPLYTINCIKAFCPDCYVHPKLTFFCIILSHLNSAVNPVLYAYHLKDFRAALKNLILKVIGIEVEQPPELNYRFSLASQHRLQSLIDKRTSSLQNRIYIDSPVWLRQQQNKQEQLAKASSITRSLNSVHQTVAAVASSTTEINRDIWNIIEVPSCADENSQYNRDIDDNDDDDESISGESLSSFPKNDHHNNNNNNNSIDDVQNKLSEQNQSQFLYENRNFSFSLNDLGDGEDDEVFLSPSSIKEIFIINNQTQQEQHQQEQQQQHQQLKTQNKREKIERKLTKSNSISIDDITTIDNTIAKNENETKMKDYFSQNNRDDTNTIRVHKNENSIYIIENDKSPLSTHRQYYNNKSTVIQKIQSSKIFSPIRMTKSVTVYHQDDRHNDHQHHHDININSNNNNCYNNTEKFSPLKTVSNLIFSSAKTSSLFHISENCLESAIRKRRTSADS